jgi:hypothetical protein
VQLPTLRAHKGAKMFSDLGEQEHVFSLLDEWANYQLNYDLAYLTGNKSLLNTEISKVMDAVQKLEEETIKKNPRLKIGFSFQSDLLGKLWYLLINSNTSGKLLANLSGIKILLLQAMIISTDIKYEKLVLINTENSIYAEIGKSRKKQIKGWSKKGSDAVKKYTEEDKKNWLTSAEELRNKNPKLSFRSLAQCISTNDKNRPSVEVVRKYLSNKMG